MEHKDNLSLYVQVYSMSYKQVSKSFKTLQYKICYIAIHCH